MINNTFEERKITSSKDHLSSYNIVKVFKHTIVNDDKTLQNCKEADLSG